MLILLGAIYLFIVFCIGILILLVLHKNRRNELNRAFASFLFSVMIWVILNYLSNLILLSSEVLLFINHLLLAVSSILFVLLIIFCAELFDSSNRNILKKWLLPMGLLNAALAMTPYVVNEIERQEHVVALDFGVLAPIYFLIIATFCTVLVVLFRGAIKMRRQAQKQRALVMSASLLLTLLLIISTNIVIPITTGFFELSAFGPLFASILLGGTGYAMIKHRLFDVRSVVARSLAYILSITSIVTIYSAVAFGLIESLFQLSEVNGITKIVYSITAIGLAVTFGPIKTFFDTITDRIFYRNSYIQQEVLDRLGSTVVNEVKLDRLVDSSLSILYESLKSSYVAMIVFDDNDQVSVSFSSDHASRRFNENILNYAKKAKTILFTSNNFTGPENIYTLLEKDDVALVVKLQTYGQLSGLIIFGAKLNGDIYSKKDINLITIAADELAVAVQNALRLKEIQSFNETLQTKVDEATNELKRSNEKLKSLDKAKDEFVSMASHQLRTPLTSIKGYVSMVLDGDAGELNPAQRKLLEESYASSQRMVYLIGDFLNVSRLNTGKFMLEPSEVNIAEVVREEVEQLRATATSRHITLHYSKPANFLSMTVDETKIRQVVMNFIDNAIFYSRPDGEVKVELTQSAHEVTFKVRDSGIGVPAKERHHLFTKFYRASNARKARPDGTGIGLFMAKKVIVAHGGTIIFETKEGEGSTFGFSLPITKNRGSATTK